MQAGRTLGHELSMINCEQAENLFEPYLTDELAPSLVAELDAHRLECDSCRRHLTLMEACGNVVRLDTNEPHISEDFTDRLMAIMNQDPARRGWLQIDRRLKIVGVLLGTAATIALLVTLYPKDAPRVLGKQDQPITAQTVSTARLLMGLPVDLLFDATDSFSSSIELGHYGINHLSSQGSAQDEALPANYPAFPLPPAQTEPQLDVIELLPDLDDGAELM